MRQNSEADFTKRLAAGWEGRQQGRRRIGGDSGGIGDYTVGHVTAPAATAVREEGRKAPENFAGGRHIFCGGGREGVGKGQAGEVGVGGRWAGRGEGGGTAFCSCGGGGGCKSGAKEGGRGHADKQNGLRGSVDDG